MSGEKAIKEVERFLEATSRYSKEDTVRGLYCHLNSQKARCRALAARVAELGRERDAAIEELGRLRAEVNVLVLGNIQQREAMGKTWYMARPMFSARDGDTGLPFPTITAAMDAVRKLFCLPLHVEPCPCCKGGAELQEDGGATCWYECRACSFCGSDKETEQEARAAWNDNANRFKAIGGNGNGA
jgi:hypothetical protein